MKHIVESTEELYRAREPTGEIIIDEVVNVLRHFKMIYPEDVALILEVDVKELSAAWHLLTGINLIDVITQWRLFQAQELILKDLIERDTEGIDKREARKFLNEVARRCGWRSERVMSHVFERYCGCSAIEWQLQQIKS